MKRFSSFWYEKRNKVRKVNARSSMTIRSNCFNVSKGRFFKRSSPVSIGVVHLYVKNKFVIPVKETDKRNIKLY